MNPTRDITVLVADRPYPLRIQEGDEPTLRRLVKEINDKITLFQQNYPRKDKQDCLALAILTYAVELHKTQTTAQHAPTTADAPTQSATVPDFEPIHDRLSALEQLLDAVSLS
ncbi:MAG: hypothetical protein RL757_2160 [Bacteroidota bacterium]|jgi:cell division protein ZapA